MTQEQGCEVPIKDQVAHASLLDDFFTGLRDNLPPASDVLEIIEGSVVDAQFARELVGRSGLLSTQTTASFIFSPGLGRETRLTTGSRAFHYSGDDRWKPTVER